MSLERQPPDGFLPLRGECSGFVGRNVVRALLLVASASVFACDATPPETGEGTQALREDEHPIDGPGTPAIVMQWRTPRDGAEAVASLEFDVLNTTGEPIEVELHASTRSSGDGVERSAGRVRIGAKSKAGRAISVDHLGLQTVGSAASTLLVATYKGPDGLTRSAPLNPVWVEHLPGYKTARVRSEGVEARENARAGLARMLSRRASEARAFDPASRSFVNLAASDERLRPGGVVAQVADLPNPRDFKKPRSSSQVPEVAERADAESSSASNKNGLFRICFEMPYFYVDSDLGDDHLNAQTSSAVGWEPARYMFALLGNSANQLIWSGHLGFDGCTTAVDHPNGQYVAFLTTSIFRESSNVTIDVTATSAKEFIYGSTSYSVSTNGTGNSLWIRPVGYSSLQQVDVAMAAANSLYRATDAYPAGTHTDIFTDEFCTITNPNTGQQENTGCATADTIKLGFDKHGMPNGYYKVVTHHELGHRVQRALFGPLNNDYFNDATQAACMCSHVTSSNSAHCLQGRHFIWSAQVEGWGQFFAAASLNLGSESDCVLPYYKEFRENTGVVTAPPVVKSCFAQVRWRQNNCGNVAARGVEWDWMNFYWRLDKKDGYSFADFSNVYKRACGGACTGNQLSWSPLGSAANGQFGAGSVKANAWSNQGTAFGVAN